MQKHIMQTLPRSICFFAIIIISLVPVVDSFSTISHKNGNFLLWIHDRGARRSQSLVVRSISNDTVDDTAPPANDDTNNNIDPLFKAVTRMDSATANAKTMQVPLWGELILDKSLFVLLPIAMFGILGILSAILVLLNTSTDEFATAILASDSTTTDGSCRGLCTNDNDIEGLRQYMMGLSGRTK